MAHAHLGGRRGIGRFSKPQVDRIAQREAAEREAELAVLSMTEGDAAGFLRRVAGGLAAAREVEAARGINALVEAHVSPEREPDANLFDWDGVRDDD